MTLLDQLKQKREAIIQVGHKHGANNIRIFGSVARGETTPDSDVDFLIDKQPETSAWFPAGLIVELEEMLGRRVEVVTEKALNRHLREHVLREAVPL